MAHRKSITDDTNTLRLFLIVKADPDPYAAWDSCIAAAVDCTSALAWCGLDAEDVDHITDIGRASTDVEEGIVLSQKD